MIIFIEILKEAEALMYPLGVALLQGKDLLKRC